MANFQRSLTDSTDWSFGPLKELDRLLRCSICMEYYETPMILPCLHCFCSLCIRRYLQVKSFCPSCSKPVSDSQLLRNVVVEELITSFCQNRKAFMSLCESHTLRVEKSSAQFTSEQPILNERSKTGTSSSSDTTDLRGKRKRRRLEEASGKDELTMVPSPPPSLDILFEEDGDISLSLLSPVSTVSSTDLPLEPQDPPPPPPPLSTTPAQCPPHAPPSGDPAPCSTRHCASSSHTPTVTSTLTIKEEDTPDRQATNSTESPTTADDAQRVDCPICGLHIMEKYINTHLDMCLKHSATRTASNSHVSHGLPRLPKLCFNIMKDRELKKRLKEYHLSTAGSRKDMIARLREFTIRYNAQCDSSNPKTIAQIAGEVVSMETTLMQPIKRSSVTRNLSRMSSDEEVSKEHKSYLEAHKAQFSKLVNDIKQREKTTGNSSKPQQVELALTSESTSNYHSTPTRSSSGCSKRRRQSTGKADSEYDSADNDPDFVPSHT